VLGPQSRRSALPLYPREAGYAGLVEDQILRIAGKAEVKTVRAAALFRVEIGSSFVNEEMPKPAFASLLFRIHFYKGSWTTITQRSYRTRYITHVFSPDQHESITFIYPTITLTKAEVCVVGGLSTGAIPNAASSLDRDRHLPR
jgi:hypothetical protein